MTVTLDPAVRTLPDLIAAAAAAFAIEARHVESIVKAPDVLLADDDDVRWLSDGDEIHLCSSARRRWRRPMARSAPNRRRRCPSRCRGLAERGGAGAAGAGGRAGVERGAARRVARLAPWHGWDAWG